MNADGISSSDSASPLLHPADEFDMISGLSLNPQSADRGCVCSRSRTVYSGSSSPHSASPEIFDPAERLVGREHETSLMTSWLRNGGGGPGPDGTNRTASELPSEWKDLAHICGSARAKFDFNRGNEDRNCRIHPDEKNEVKSDQLRENCTNASILESPSTSAFACHFFL